MKKLLVLCLSLFTTVAFSQSFQWVREGSGIGQDVGQRVAVDKAGNVYATGNIAGEAEFSGTLYVGNGIFDVFVAKYDASGNLLWLRTAGSVQADAGLGIKTDSNANVYVTGYFSEIAEFRDPAGHIVHLQSNGDNDIFIAKYDSSGNLLWAKKAGGIREDKANNLVVDQFNNIFITGHFSDRCYFDTQTAVSEGNTDVFLAKYDSLGNCLWVQTLGGSGLDKAFGLDVDSSGSAYINGFFYYDASLSNSSTVLYCDGLSSDIFIAKYASNGNNEWARRLGGPYNDAAFGIVVDYEESYYITGYFLEIAEFGDFDLDAAGYNDIFVVKFDSLNECVWAINQGGVHLDMGLDIDLDTEGNVYVAGTFDSIGFFGGETLYSVDYYDMFIAKYNDKGNLIWVRQAGGDMGDFALGLCVPEIDLVYVTGYYKNFATFGSIVSRWGEESDIFLTKIDFGVGIGDEPKTDSPLLLYPNPSDGFFTLKLPDELSQKALITVSDVQGKQIFKQERNSANSSVRLELNNYSAGLYFATVRDEKFSLTGRMVILK